MKKATLKAEVAAKKPAAKGFKKPGAARSGSEREKGISDSLKVEGQKLTLTSNLWFFGEAWSHRLHGAFDFFHRRNKFLGSLWIVLSLELKRPG